MPQSIVLAVSGLTGLGGELTGQLEIDGHVVHHALNRRHAVSLLAGRDVDVLILGVLDRPTERLDLLRELRAGTLATRAWPDVPVIALASPRVDDREVDALRAYEAGSDHHLPDEAGYLHLRAVLHALVRRVHGSTRRVHRVGEIEVDVPGRNVRVAGAPVDLSAKEFGLLAMLASEPQRVFTKAELLRDVWGFPEAPRTRTVDSHACRLRRKLAERGADAVVNVWGVGYRLSET